MKYIIYADIEGLSVDFFTRLSYRVAEIPIEVLSKHAFDAKNLTMNYLSTNEMNKLIGTKYEISDFTSCLDIGDLLFIVTPFKGGQNGIIHRFYKVEVFGDQDKIIRRPETRYIKDFIDKCNSANAQKANTPKTESNKSKEWAVRDYFNRVDKAYRLYDSALMKDKPETHSQLAYNKRTLARDLDLAFKRACDAHVSVEDIRDVENRVLYERLRRIENG